MYITNKIGPKTDPCGTPLKISFHSDTWPLGRLPLVETTSPSRMVVQIAHVKHLATPIYITTENEVITIFGVWEQIKG